jgi:hypothetical protein
VLLRYLFGFHDEMLTGGAVDPNCKRCDPAAMESYIDELGLLLDVDDNGSVVGLSDGMLALRFLFGFSDEALTDGVVATDCHRCDSESLIEYLSILAGY